MQQRRPMPSTAAQGSQDKDDEKAKMQKAQHDLEKSWMNRLQVISAITTFFASAEAQLLSLTTRRSQGGPGTAIEQISNAGLSGGLIVHSFAAIFSFFAAFVLVRYQLHEAIREAHKGESEAENKGKLQGWSSDPHLVIRRAGFRREEPPEHILRRFHSLCVFLAVIGFIMAVIGTICFVWAQQAHNVAVFSSVCMGLCLLAGLVVGLTNAKDIHIHPLI